MRTLRTIALALGLCELAAACGGSGSRPADDHNAASDVLTTVAPGVISTSRRNETFPAVDPLTNDLWFSAHDDDFDDQTIMISRWNGNGWSTPQVAPFSGQWGDRAPRFDAEGAAIYFTSSRPLVSGADSEDAAVPALAR